jgi:hypothetical protein
VNDPAGALPLGPEKALEAAGLSEKAMSQENVERPLAQEPEVRSSDAA